METPSSTWGPLARAVHHDDDVPHLERVGLPWRDNAFFAWWDHDAGAYGVVHVSTSLNGGGLRARCAVRIRDRDREIVEPLPIGSFRSESIAVDLEGRLVVDHPTLGVDLTMEPLFATLDFTSNRSVPSLSEEFPLHHYQRGFRARGTTRVGSSRQDVDAVGWRDRTWGYRDESAQWVDYTYANFVMPDCAVGMWVALGADGKQRRFAWRVDDDGQEPLPDVTFARDGSGLLSDVTVEGTGTFSKHERTAGWWLPMGARQTGPTFSAYDEWFTASTPDGSLTGGLAEHGTLRQVV